MLPGALPSFLVGLRYALGISWLSLVVAEQINAASGIGYLIMSARDFLRTDIILVGLIVYGLLGPSRRFRGSPAGALRARMAAFHPERLSMASALRIAEKAPPTAPAVSIRGLGQTFGATAVLNGLDLDIAPGEFVALLGRSGSGKTTLLRALAGLSPVSSGQIRVPDTRTIVFQEPRLMPWKKVWQNVALGLRGRDARARATKALHEVDLEHRLDAWPATLSGGEAQRVALARALMREPQLLLLDEPFAALDALTRIRMHDLISELWSAHRPSVLLVTHDVDEALLLADRALVLADGRIRAELPIAEPQRAIRRWWAFLRCARHYFQNWVSTRRAA